MGKLIFYTLSAAILVTLMFGCATNQPSSFQNQISKMSERKSVNEYKNIRARFIEYARSNNAEKLYEMMAFYGYDKLEMFALFKNETFPFFSNYKEILEPEIFNVVNDEAGDPGYSMYGFIKTTTNERKPYVIAIIEKGDSFVVKNFVLNKCFKGYHPNC